jgi:hypothetical protein
MTTPTRAQIHAVLLVDDDAGTEVVVAGTVVTVVWGTDVVGTRVVGTVALVVGGTVGAAVVGGSVGEVVEAVPLVVDGSGNDVAAAAVRGAKKRSAAEEPQPASTAAQHSATKTDSRRCRARGLMRGVAAGIDLRCAPSAGDDHSTDVSRLDTRVMVGSGSSSGPALPRDGIAMTSDSASR